MSRERLIFIPGFLGSKEDFLLFEKAYQPFFSIHYCLIEPKQTLDEWIQNTELLQGHYIGYSLGGRVLSYITQQFPHLVLSATFISTHPGIHQERDYIRAQQQEALWRDFLQKNSIENFLESWYSQPIFRGMKMCKIYKMNFTKEDIEGFLCHWGKTAFPYSLKDAETITRCSYLYGSYDETYKKYASMLSMPTYEIPLASHQAHIDNPHMCMQNFFGGKQYENIY